MTNLVKTTVTIDAGVYIGTKVPLTIDIDKNMLYAEINGQTINSEQMGDCIVRLLDRTLVKKNDPKYETEAISIKIGIDGRRMICKQHPDIAEKLRELGYFPKLKPQDDSNDDDNEEPWTITAK